MTDSIERALGRMEGKLDSVIATLEAQVKTNADVDERVTTLEKWQSRVLGGAVVAGFVAGIVVKVLA